MSGRNQERQTAGQAIVIDESLLSRRAGRRRLLLTCILAVVAAGLPEARGSNDGWRLVFADDFNRPFLGANWRWVFGDGRRYLVENAVHLSHDSTVQCVVPLPEPDVRVELDLTWPTRSFTGTNSTHSIHLELRSGEVGAGGRQESFAAVFVPGADSGEPALDADGNIRIALDQPHHVRMQIHGGTGSVAVDDKTLRQEIVPAPRSEIHRFFVFRTKGLNGVPGKEAVLDNFKMWAGPRTGLKLPLRPNSADENRRATRRASDFMDAANPGSGMQQAIDSLPASGGLVILPAGEFVLRRQLRLRDNVTLRGQGAGKTVLKADSGDPCAILELKRGPGECVVTVAPKDTVKFRVGDGVCFGQNWGHPGFPDLTNKDCLVTAVSNNRITVRGTAPEEAKELRRWFPLVYAHCAEFVELKDLTLIGGEGGWGGFESSAVTFGEVAGARISRVHITHWLGDGISVQRAGDDLVADNTVTGVSQGYHPGTTTQRFLCTRNLGLGNQACGLYYCWDNRNGIAYRNLLDRFDGYAWPDDSFDVIAGNVCTSVKGFGLEQGCYGVVFNNQFEQIRVGHGHAGAPTFGFLVAANRAGDFRFIAGDVQHNLFVGNLSRAGDQPVACAETRSNNLFSARGVELDMGRFPCGIERTGPVEPPVFPQPVLDGGAFYRPNDPSAGFQKALDQLAKTGGTLLLPAGRYGLARPLVVPDRVTLAGCGLGTVLHAARAGDTNSLVIARNAAQVTIRDLVILGEYERRAFRSPAIVFQDVARGELTAVDVRGWEGTAVQVSSGGVEVRDCRALGCAGAGFEFCRCRVTCASSIARECTTGFTLSRTVPGSRVEGNIAGGNRGDGYAADQAPGLLLTANNASFNDGDGFVLTDTEGADLVGNMAAMSNQAATDGCGIRLAGATRGCRICYNNCQDEQMQPTQLKAIDEEAGAARNVIRFNLARQPASILANGHGSMVGDNPVN